MKYRSEIDGLRAIAVLPVILYHAGFELFSGGFIGVDIFFVISGYLITSLILEQKIKGDFSLLYFYERRARRILPALFLVMFCITPLAFFSMEPNQLEAFSGSLIAATLFLSNVLFSFEASYFGIAAELKPLLHTWSLAVEEQYYLLFPLLILLVGKRKILLSIICVGILLSFCLSQLGGNLSVTYPYIENNFYWMDVPSWAFFNTTTRIWEIMIGALTAIYLIEKQPFKGFTAELTGILGLCLILGSIVFFEKFTPHPSVYTLAPVLGTALIILGVSPSTFVGRIFSMKILVSLGLISYSAYLWHYPLFAFSKILLINKAGIEIILITITFVLAYISTNFIEKPFRDKGILTTKQVVVILSIAAVTLIILGLIGKGTSGFKTQYYESVIPENRYLLIDTDQLNKQRREFWSISRQNELKKDFQNDSRHKILILGDSHSEDLAAAFLKNSDLVNDSFQVRRITFSEECFAKVSSPDIGRRCKEFASSYQNSSKPDAADYIFLSARWSKRSAGYMSDLYTWLGENANKVVFFSRTAEYSDTAEIAKSLSGKDAKVFLKDASRLLAKYRNVDLDALNQALNTVVGDLGWPVVNRLSLSCHSGGNYCDFFSSEGRPYYSDYGHWTEEGAKFFGEKLLSAGFKDWIETFDSKTFSVESEPVD